MDQQLELSGFWHQPESPELKVGGTITYSFKKGIILKLSGGFKNLNLSTLWGNVNGGKKITLQGAWISNRKGDFSKYTESTVRVNVMFIGSWINDITDLRIYSITVKCLYLNEWYNKSWLNSRRTHNPLQVELSTSEPESVVAIITNSLTFKIKTIVTSNFSSKPDRNMSLIERHYFELKSTKYLSFEKALSLAFHALNFLIVCVQRESYIQEMKLTYKLKGNRQNLYTADIYYNLTSECEVVDVHSSNMLLPYCSIEDNFDRIIRQWFSIHQTLLTSIIPYTANFHSKYTYVSDKFLNLTTSMEAFHRDFVDTRDVIFIRRVKDLLKSTSRVFNSQLKIRNLNTLSVEIKNERNNWTHFNPIATTNKKSLRLHKLSEFLKLVMAIAFLKEIGVNQTKIKSNIEASHSYKKF